MAERPYTILSAGMSLDGYLDDGTEERLLLSGAEDFDRVDEVRAGADAILVGAGTVRHDDPRLLVRSPERIAARRRRGLSDHPLKVTVTARAKLDAEARFFTTGETAKLVYCAADTVEMARGQLGHLATVIDGGAPLRMARVSEDLGARGVRRLMVEGGGQVHTQLLAAGLADELHLAVAPFLVGRPEATRFVGPAAYPHGPERRARLVETRTLGDVVLLRYALSERFDRRPAW